MLPTFKEFAKQSDQSTFVVKHPKPIDTLYHIGFIGKGEKQLNEEELPHFLVDRTHDNHSDFHPFSGEAPRNKHFMHSPTTDFHPKMADHYKASFKKAGLGAKRWKAFQAYKDDSGPVNKHLFKNNGEAKNPYKNRVEHLDDVLKSARTPHDLHVYSGVHFDPSQMPVHNGKIHVALPAYTSTSLDRRMARAFGKHYSVQRAGKKHIYDTVNHMVKIHVPEGSRGHYYPDHEDQEQEFVLPRGSKLHIHPEPQVIQRRATVSAGDPTHHTTYLWHARLVHDGSEATKWMHHND